MPEIETTRTVRVSVAGTIRRGPCPMGQLATCDQFAGPAGVAPGLDGTTTLYEVRTSCANQPAPYPGPSCLAARHHPGLCAAGRQRADDRCDRGSEQPQSAPCRCS